MAVPQINGTAGNDVLYGGDGSQGIFGSGGDDIIAKQPDFDLVAWLFSLVLTLMRRNFEIKIASVSYIYSRAGIDGELDGGFGDDVLGTQNDPLIVDAEEGLVLTGPRTAYTDPEGNDVQLDILEAENGTITELEDGRLRFLPDDGFEGLAKVECGVSDGDGDAQSDIFFLSVVAEEGGNVTPKEDDNTVPEEGGGAAPEDESGTESDEVSETSDDASVDGAGLDWLIALFLGVAVFGATQGMGGGF